MRRRLFYNLKTVSRFGNVKHVWQNHDIHGFCRAIYTATPPQSWDTAVPHDLLFGEQKTEFIKRIEKLSKWYKPPIPSSAASLAGIFVPFCIADGKPSVLLTKRSHKLVRNKGDVCFPGGKMDDDDEDIIETVLRETEEEIGLPRTNVEIWLKSRAILTSDRVLKVVPVIGFVKHLDISSLTIDHNEVTSVFTIPIEDFCHPGNQAYTKYRNGFIMPLFFKDTYKIWGFTAIILDFLLANLMPNTYTLKCNGYQH